jgi:ABC-type phosphate transport system substrate-binding protein
MRSLGLLYALLASFVYAFALGAAPTTHAAPDDKPIWVIAHKSVPVNALSREDLRPIFQTRKTTWPDGSTVRPFNLMPTARSRQVFDEVVLGLSPELMPRYWIDRRVRGEPHPPKTVPSDVIMLKVIKSLAGAVGYLEAATVDPSVKVLARVVGGQVTAP